MDIPSDMRNITQLWTTLGHKTSAAFFDESNTDFDMGFVKIFSKTDQGQNRNSSGATSSIGANTLCDCKATNCQRRRGVVLFGLSSILRSLQLLVDYNYDLKTAAMWYRQDYLRALKAQERKQKSLNWKYTHPSLRKILSKLRSFQMASVSKEFFSQSLHSLINSLINSINKFYVLFPIFLLLSFFYFFPLFSFFFLFSLFSLLSFFSFFSLFSGNF